MLRRRSSSSVEMKCWIPEIFWHGRDPVLSVDIQPKMEDNSEHFYRLASGGTDSHILIWRLNTVKTDSTSLELVADLTRHQRAVNVVRWSPSGEFLVSGDDESVIYVWIMRNENDNVQVDRANEDDKEDWIIHKILRGHLEDVYDICWSPDSNFMISGSVDNTAIIWDIKKGKSIHIIDDHKGFVQGVAWDPNNILLATLSADRHFRVFDAQTKKTISRSYKSITSVVKPGKNETKSMRLFHDDTLQTYFRRLCFSPDGILILTPSGVAEFQNMTSPVHTTYIYTRHSLTQPSITLQSPDQYTVAAKFCPVYFKLQPYTDDNLPIITLPYRMVFAVATKNSVYLYDTQQKMPFLLIANIHYTGLTDLTWSNDGHILVVSSTDGFCSLITFGKDDLGEIYEAVINEDLLKDGRKEIPLNGQRK